MHYLIVANLLLSATLIVAAIGGGIYLYVRRRRRKQVLPRRDDPARDYAAAGPGRRPGSLNYSSFVYLDVDRNGRYSLADRPMGGIVVRLSGKGGHLSSVRTNLNGFANFTTSARSRRADIHAAGNYTFTVSVPPGWRCTSGNEIQTAAFDFIAGSPAGIGAPEMVTPVGLAPIRFVRGRTAGGPATLSFLQGGESIFRQVLDPDGPFRVEAPEGADAIALEGPDFKRSLVLSTYSTDLGLVSPERSALASDSVLETVDFDGVTPRGLRKIPSGYAGLNWFNLNAISRDFHAGSEGYVNGTTSGDHSCYTSSGHPAEIWSERPFGFHSVMLSSAWLTAESEIAQIDSWLGDTLVASDLVAVSALGPVRYAPMLEAVTRIRLSSKRYWQLVVDDLTVVR